MFQMSAADLAPQTAGEEIVYRTVVVGRLACNCTVVGNRRTKEVRVGAIRRTRRDSADC